MSKPSEGYEILWNKKARISEKDRQLIKNCLIQKMKTIEKTMEIAKEEDLNDRPSEIRLHLASRSRQKFYLTIECCENAWHLFLETCDTIVAEIVKEKGPFIKLLKDENVEVERVAG